jgi:threonyl-tRNA synthetase
MLVVGGREQEDGTVSVRARHRDDPGVMPVDDLATKLLDEIANKT